jgi:6-phosphofructokinase 2
VPQLIPDHKLYASDERIDPGGGGINVARIITRLGGQARAIWTRGGVFGDLLARLLDEEGIDHAAVPISGNTRENVIVHETTSQRLYRLDMPGPALTQCELDICAGIISEAALSHPYVVFSGSLPPGVPPEWLGATVEKVAKSAQVIADTKGDSLRAAIAAGAYLVKPNKRELQDLVGRELVGDEEIEAAAKSILVNSSLGAIIVSLGPGGALLITRETGEKISSPSVPVQSSVGAGDCMVGAMVLALSRGDDIRQAARFGVAAGAAAVMARGTRLAAREHVERLYAEMAR